jgi:hypothetical protein
VGARVRALDGTKKHGRKPRVILMRFASVLFRSVLWPAFRPAAHTGSSLER